MMKKSKKLLSVLLTAIVLCSMLPVNAGAAANQTSGYWIYSTYGSEATITGYTYTSTSGTAIPSEINGYRVTAIGDGAFYNCFNLAGLSIPSTIKTIGNGAFQHCHMLNNVTVPASVTSIGYSAFNDCTRLTNLRFEGNPVLYDNSLITGSNLTVYCKASSTNVINFCTRNNIKYELTDGPGIPTTISFTDSSGTWVYNTSTKALVSYTGTASALTIPTSFTNSNGTFKVERLGNNLFKNNTTLTNVTVPGSIGYIEMAFRDCTSLKYVWIENGVKSIGAQAFYGCSNLEVIYIYGNPGVGYQAFYLCPKLKVYCYPSATFVIEFCKNNGVPMF